MRQAGASGASIACGQVVGAAAAWPARLEAMLKAKGYDVSMAVSCLNGDDGAAILGRIGALLAGTRIILYMTGGTNNAKKGEGLGVVVGQIAGAIRARGAVGIRVAMSQIDGIEYQADGIHPTAVGHQRIAAALLPQVTAALAKQAK